MRGYTNSCSKIYFPCYSSAKVLSVRLCQDIAITEGRVPFIYSQDSRQDEILTLCHIFYQIYQ